MHFEESTKGASLLACECWHPYKIVHNLGGNAIKYIQHKFSKHDMATLHLGEKTILVQIQQSYMPNELWGKMKERKRIVCYGVTHTPPDIVLSFSSKKRSLVFRKIAWRQMMTKPMTRPSVRFS